MLYNFPQTHARLMHLKPAGGLSARHPQRLSLCDLFLEPPAANMELAESRFKKNLDIGQPAIPQTCPFSMCQAS